MLIRLQRLVLGSPKINPFRGILPLGLNSVLCRFLLTESKPESQGPFKKLFFRDHASVFQHLDMVDLIRAYAVFQICGLRLFVENAQYILALGNRLSPTLTSYILRHTFFRHFVAGETSEEVWKTMEKLQNRGVSAILDYAAEDDVGACPAPTRSSKPPDESLKGHPTVVKGTENKEAVARVYDYGSEAQCDRHVETFLKAVDTAAGLPGQGFAAIKLTALGNPQLLERLSSAIQLIRGLFAQFDSNGSGFIEASEFLAAYKSVFPSASPADAARVFSHFSHGSPVDYISWCQHLSLKQMPTMAESIHQAYGDRDEMKGWLGDLSSCCLTTEEYQLVLAMKQRLDKIVQRAVDKHVKLMIDAEHSYFQPAIDHLALQAMKKYNVNGRAVIYNTYQAYLTSTHKRLCDDMERAKREGYRFACKLVRGAYLTLERERASLKGYPSPVWGTLEETHTSYEACARSVLLEVAKGLAEVLLGSHNEESIQLAVSLMSDLGLRPGSSPVYFGQLLGMADHITFTLGNKGYPAYKYVPYGLVQEVVPYLLRRAQENASVMSGTKADASLLRAEIWRRIRGGGWPWKYGRSKAA